MTMQTTTKRSFTDEFKREAVSLLASSDRPLTQVAIELGIQPSMLRSWLVAAWRRRRWSLRPSNLRSVACGAILIALRWNVPF